MDAPKIITSPLRGFTLTESLVALTATAFVFTAAVPLFEHTRRAWESKEDGTVQTLQNGRLAIEHIRRNLSGAAKITDVSDPSETSGHIAFENTEGGTFRYDIAANCLRFGPEGSPAELAFNVNRLQFTCYDASDHGQTTTDSDAIRVISAGLTVTGSGGAGLSQDFSTIAYLRTNANPDPRPDPNLIVYYTFNDETGSTVTDRSGSRNNGFLSDSMTADSWVSGQTGGALKFDGSADHVRVPDDEDLYFSGDFTIAAWIFVSESLPASRWTHLVSKYDSYWLQICGGRPTFYVNGLGDLRASMDLPLQCWTHIAAVFEKGQAESEPCSRKIYINGILDTDARRWGTPTGRLAQTPPWFHAYCCSDCSKGLHVPNFNQCIRWVARNSPTNALYIGAFTGNQNFFPGRIDEVRLYNRALSADDITALPGFGRGGVLAQFSIDDCEDLDGAAYDGERYLYYGKNDSELRCYDTLDGTDALVRVVDNKTSLTVLRISNNNRSAADLINSRGYLWTDGSGYLWKLSTGGAFSHWAALPSQIPTPVSSWTLYDSSQSGGDVYTCTLDGDILRYYHLETGEAADGFNIGGDGWCVTGGPGGDFYRIGEDSGQTICYRVETENATTVTPAPVPVVP